MPKIINPNRPVTYYGVFVREANEYVTTGQYSFSIKLSKNVSVYNRRQDAVNLIQRAASNLDMPVEKFEVVEIELIATVKKTAPPKIQPVAQEQSSRDTTIIKKLLSGIAEQLGVNAKHLKPTDTIYDHGADSLDAVEVVMMIEDEFDIQIDEDTCTKLFEYHGPNTKTIQDIIDYLKSQKSLNLTM